MKLFKILWSCGLYNNFILATNNVCVCVCGTAINYCRMKCMCRSSFTLNFVFLVGYKLTLICSRSSHTHCTWESSCHLDKITFVTTPSRANSPNRFAIESSKPLKCVFQVSTMATSRTPNIHTRYRFVTNKAHTDTTSTFFTNFSSTG